MWQDQLLMLMQGYFAAALVPALLDTTQKPAIVTSLLNAVGVAVIVGIYFSLGLFWSAAVTTVVSLEWFVLLLQRRQHDKRMGMGRNTPLWKLLDQLLVR